MELNELQLAADRIPCSFCFHTINSEDSNKQRRDAVATVSGEYFHSSCINNMQSPPKTRPVQLPPPPSLPALIREASNVSIEVTNSLDDKPLGISDSRIYLQQIDIQEFLVKNNTTNELEFVSYRTAPWLHAEVTEKNGANRSDITRNGGIVLQPDTYAGVRLIPHPIRPSSHRHRLFLHPENYLVVYSGGNDTLVWIACVVLIIVWLLFWSAFTSLGNVFNNLSFIVNSDPMRLVISILKLYFYSSLMFMLSAILMPSTVLWFTRRVLCSIGDLASLPNSTVWGLPTLDRLLTEQERLQLRGDNLGKLLLYIVVISLGVALPWVIVIALLTLLFINLFAVGWLFYFTIFFGSVYLLYLFLKNYDLLRSLNVEDPIERIRNEISKRMQIKAE